MLADIVMEKTFFPLTVTFSAYTYVFRCEGAALSLYILSYYTVGNFFSGVGTFHSFPSMRLLSSSVASDSGAIYMC